MKIFPGVKADPGREHRGLGEKPVTLESQLEGRVSGGTPGCLTSAEEPVEPHNKVGLSAGTVFCKIIPISACVLV